MNSLPSEPFASVPPAYDATFPSPRPRGRPPKDRELPQQADSAPEQEETIQEPPTLSEAHAAADLPGGSGLGDEGITPKKRGRPPKPKVLDIAAEVSPGESEPGNTSNPQDTGLVNGSVSVKRGRGRPRKLQNVVAANVPSYGVEGDLPAQVPDENAPAFSGEKRGRGRPRKLTASAAPSPSGRPRGRPRKTAVPVTSSGQQVEFSVGPETYNLEDDAVDSAGLKKRGRGRPPILGGAQMKPKIEGGGRGRPKGSVWGSEVLKRQSSVATRKLIGKLEDMKQTVMGALELLKPHGDIVDIMMAIENLEELVEMDLTD